MSDIIRLLPDSVANQIAAGEVIQRPASAVKELMENAVDAGATSIKLIIKEAGKVLIQVIDNGCGMSDTDARMSFERHATSKIQHADDLWKIRTKGFRGEALASIAAVAQVELRSRKTENELGTLIEIENSEVKRQEPVGTPAGTSIAVRNLFFNVPARRNFLKSNNIEFRHILDEFQRVALAHPEIGFHLIHNGLDYLKLNPENLRKRVVSIFGNGISEALVPIQEETTILSIKGFVGKPEFAKKTRGEQYFFVNKRFIRDGYLNHAVLNAYEQLLPQGTFPPYFIYIDIDPSKIDINIHPTKTEIKFEDEKSVYAIIRSAVKHSLGQYSIAPSLDFSLEPMFSTVNPKEFVARPPEVKLNTSYNPFAPEMQPERPKDYRFDRATEFTKGSELFSGEHAVTGAEPLQALETETVFQVSLSFVFAVTKQGIWLIDQQLAHERVLYERFLESLKSKKPNSQSTLFPKSIELSPTDFACMMEMQEELKCLGFDIREFGKNTIVVHAVPSDLNPDSAPEAIEEILEQYKNYPQELSKDRNDRVAQTMSKSLSIKHHTPLSSPQMKSLVEELFACEIKNYSPYGMPCAVLLKENDLHALIKKNK